ncbi:MAG TPA: hypothetical protein ENI31_01715 [Candidatus Omnitrophica bacterium]|nr:hypothetical protein [Candidatus Omnitrophota bacterium]
MSVKSKTIVTLNIAGAVVLILLAFINSNLERKIQNYAVQVKETVAKNKLEELRKEIRVLKKKFKGLTEVFRVQKEEEVLDPEIFFAQKINSLRKQLLRKAEAKGINPPQMEVPKSLPPQEEIPYYLAQLENLERAIDLGLSSNIDFESVKILEPISLGSLRQLSMELGFRTEGSAFSKYLLLLVENKPLLDIDYLEFKTEAGIEGVIKISNTLVNKEAFNLVSQDIQGLDYRGKILVEDGLKERFLKNKIFAKKEKILVPVEKSQPLSSKVQRFFYRGIGTLRGEKVAALEDSLKGEVLFLTIGDRVEAFEVKEFSDTQLILENIKTYKRLILKRE